MKAAVASLGAGSGGIVIMPVRVMSYFKAVSERSGFMGTGSSSLDERQVVRNVRGEVEVGGDIFLQAARILAVSS